MRKIIIFSAFLFAVSSPVLSAVLYGTAGAEDSSGAGHFLLVERDSGTFSVDYYSKESGAERIFTDGGQITSPAVSVTRDGFVLAAWTALSGKYDAVFAARRTAEGWDEPVKVSADKPYPAVLPEFHTAEDGRVYIFWLGYDGERYVSRSAVYAGGGEWAAEEYIPSSAPQVLAAAENLDWNKYVGFGDSLTAGARRVPWSGDGYISPLAGRLRDMINPSANVVNKGRGGERTIGGVNRIDSVLREEMAGHILIMEGVNDLQARLSYNAILFNLQEMARKSLDFGTVPVVGVLPPRDDSHAWQSYTEEFNDHYLRPYLKEEGILMADHWKYFNEQDNWRDFLDPGDQHPNPAGYDLLAEAWFVALEPNEPPSGFTGWKEQGCTVLAWEPNTEYGHAGYNVYRSVGQVEGFQKLNEELLTDTSFRDCEPPEGHLYYAAVAVDKNGNESDFSEFYVVDSGSNGMCFIASAAFGSPLAEDVAVLSRFRDVFLMKSGFGRFMVRAYYKLGPGAAGALGDHPFAAGIVRFHLKPIVRAAGILLN